MKHIKLYENFDFNDDEFDFEEEAPNNFDINKYITLYDLEKNTHQVTISVEHEDVDKFIQLIEDKGFKSEIAIKLTKHYNKHFFVLWSDKLYSHIDHDTGDETVMYNSTNENFDFDFDDFDFEEEDPNIRFKIGDTVKSIDQYTDYWYDGEWENADVGNRTVKDIKHTNDMTTPPPDYNGIMLFLNGTSDNLWFKIDDFEK